MQQLNTERYSSETILDCSKFLLAQLQAQPEEAARGIAARLAPKVERLGAAIPGRAAAEDAKKGATAKVAQRDKELDAALTDFESALLAKVRKNRSDPLYKTAFGRHGLSELKGLE